MRKRIKIALSWTLWWAGDLVSKWPYGGLYWLYNWLMTRSTYLDEWDAVWVSESEFVWCEDCYEEIDFEKIKDGPNGELLCWRCLKTRQSKGLRERVQPGLAPRINGKP